MDIDSLTRKHCKTKSDEVAYDQGMRINPGRASKVLNFFRNYLYHHTGRWAGRNFDLLDWQWNDLVLPAFGWLRPDGTRRFRRVYCMIPKKNGKSTLSGGLGLYMTCADNEPSSHVYCVACDKKQASIVFNEAVKMLTASRELSALMYPIPSKKRISYDHTYSHFEVLSSDAKTKEGYNIHGLVCDEVHAWHKGTKLWASLKYAGASRSQPLFIMITTAGDEKSGLWWDELDYSKKVLSGEVIDTRYLPVIYAADEEDDIHDEKTWHKANPSLGKTMDLEEFRSDYEQAKNSPEEWSDWLRYRLNLATTSYNKWLDMSVWHFTPQTLSKEKLQGKKCYVGFDLSSKIDLSGFVFYFPKFHALIPFAFCSRDSLSRRRKERKEPLDRFERNGELIVHDGPAVDHIKMFDRFKIEAKKYDVKMCGFDRWNAHTMMDLVDAEGYDVFECSQQFSGMSEPMKELQVEILKQQIQHFNNGLLAWNFGNVVQTSDGNGNIKPMKNRSPDKIDLAVASIIAKACHVHTNVIPTSVYETENIYGESTRKTSNKGNQ